MLRIPLLKGEGGPKGRVRGKDLISLPLTRRFAAPFLCLDDYLGCGVIRKYGLIVLNPGNLV